MRLLTLFTLMLLIAVSYGLYQLKYRVEALQERAVALDKQLERDRTAIEVLNAEWVFLTRPQRLQTLSDEFLELKPLKPTQIVTSLKGIGPRPFDAADADPLLPHADGAPLGGFAYQHPDPAQKHPSGAVRVPVQFSVSDADSWSGY
ncbi:MAG: hypothetical protein R3360_00630 [Alphaproteobacteria bacterium]|nr:hypothetical protein [Alphaproteobacteria bacterium]